MKTHPRFLYFSILFLLVAAACSLPSLGTATPPATSPEPDGGYTGGETVIPYGDGPSLPVSYPTDPSTIVSSMKDEVFPSDYGDDYQINLYERPFQLDNIYRPDADISWSFLADDGGWLYFSAQVMGFNPATYTADAPFGFEIDVDLDGRGDYLLWAQPPFSVDWSNTSAFLAADFNEDVGHLTPMYSDAPIGKGSDGYEVRLAGAGSDGDPQAVWARQAPLDPTYLQIAVKKSVLNEYSFLWWSWTDFGISNEFLMDYNDFFTAAEAGSPFTNNPYFPLGVLYGMDNTCRAAFNFTPLGTEPGLCGGVETGQVPTTPPGSVPTGVVVLVRQTPTPTQGPPPPPPTTTGIITGFVYWDLNDNGTQDSGETGESSQPVYLYDESCHVGLTSVMPDSNGAYSFPGLALGTYCVQYAPPSGYNLGAPGEVVSGVGVNDVMPSRVDFRILPPE